MSLQKFNVLSQDAPLFGPHLLEASAGTGKTFAIEHTYVRLILEGMEVEKILAITFTRAAARELKERIRSNLEKALHADWEYLSLYPNREKTLYDALHLFDRCQIFTIHGFCYRILQEFSFEAGLCTLSDPDTGKSSEKLLRAATDFLENDLDETLLSSAHMGRFLRQIQTQEKIEKNLEKFQKSNAIQSASELYAKCKAALHLKDEADLLADFEALRVNYKAKAGNFESQVKALANLDLEVLLREGGSLFKFLHPDNLKKKLVEPALRYPGYFEEAAAILAPLLELEPMEVLQAAFRPIAERVLDEEPNPDEILRKMHKMLENSEIVSRIRGKYEAAIIDEFQDTDPVQWDIFQKLFLKLRAIYLVGDPKQSIYRFRNADIYTYLNARSVLGEENVYHLDTNYRSSKSLISALNKLFEKPWLYMPKEKRYLPYIPVQAGLNDPGEVDAVRVWMVEADPRKVFTEYFLPKTVEEIVRLQPKSCAILVHSNAQANEALRFLTEHGVRAVARSDEELSETPDYQAVVELFEALATPRDLNLARCARVWFGNVCFVALRELVEKKGLVFLARELTLTPVMMQIFEEAFAWERQEGFSFEGMRRFLRDLEGKKWLEVDEEAVQIMTMHASKGLEFDVVFALGLAQRIKEGDEETEAEKGRLLYVAMTRAKKRLYIPFVEAKRASEDKSPMELFGASFVGIESVIVERLESPVVALYGQPKDEEISFNLPLRPFTPIYLSSFTTLSRKIPHETQYVESAGFTMQTLPRGSLTGVLIHRIFERYFSEKIAVAQVVAEEMQGSPWQDTVAEMVEEVLSIRFNDTFSLREVEAVPEVEFLYTKEPHFIKGFIDLIVTYQGKVYLFDWKSNWLPEYSQEAMQEAMRVNDYYLQSEIYAEALKRYSKLPFGGAFYVFVRGKGYVYDN